MHNTYDIRRMPLLVAVLMACTLTPFVSAQSTPQTAAPSAAKPAPSDAQKAFDKLKTMAGSWQGAIMGTPIGVTIRAASSGTAVLHEATADGKGVPQQEITMFYVEDGRLLAMHYCDGGNRVRMEGKLSADGTTLDFNMLEVTGGTRGGLLKRIALTLTGAGTHAVQGTFIMPDGKPLELRGEFHRR